MTFENQPAPLSGDPVEAASLQPDSIPIERYSQRLAFNKEARAIAEPFDKLILEFDKAANEMGKMLVTLLSGINAGGLVALPAVNSLVGAMAAPERAFILKTCGAGFSIGLICAAFCALATHFNFRVHSERQNELRAQAVYQLGDAIKIYGKNAAQVAKVLDISFKSIGPLNARIFWSHLAAHAFGWLALAAFVSTCVFVAAHLN